MNILTPGFTAILFALLPFVSFAEPVDSNSASAIPSALRMQTAIPVIVNNPKARNLAVSGNSSAIYIPNLGEMTRTKLRVIFVRNNSLRGEIIHNGMLVNNDNAVQIGRFTGYPGAGCCAGRQAPSKH
jgi:hypothetical protein